MGRFMRKGVTKVYFVPTIADTEGPTVAEITAGTPLTTAIAEITGFSFTNNPINTPDMGSSFVSKIPGEDTTDDSTITFYEDKITNPIRTALSKNTAGYIVIFGAGIAGATPAAADKADVWPVTVSSNSKVYTVDNDAAKYAVGFANTAPPSEDVAVAA
jgi:hypothetical protein